jgi:multicomponent Na+:H+ antiporter subunit E
MNGVKAGRNRKRLGAWMPALLLFLLWVVLSGKLDVFHLGVGAAVVAFVVWQKRGLPALQSPELPRLRYGRLLPYGGWLLWQMVIAAVQVAVVVIHPRRHLDPQLIQFRSEQPSMIAGLVLANSITLTPGTLTVELHENRYVVHALTKKGAADLLSGDMARRVAWLFTNEPPPPIEVITPPKEGSG